MRTLQELLETGKSVLAEAGVRESELDAWYLLQYVTKINRTEFLCDRRKTVPEEQDRQYMGLIARRAERIPLQQLTGEQEFMGLPFMVNEYVLIPRQDTEVLVEEAGKLLKDISSANVLDMCTGSGCIIISLMKLYGAQKAVAADISPEALKVAERNAELNGTVVTFLQSDLFEKVTGRFNMIVSNPPYIRTAVIETLEPEVREHEPLLALDGTEDGLYFYRKIIAEAGAHLLPDGYLLFEIGHDQGQEVAELMSRYGYSDVRIVKDLPGHDRVCIGRYAAVQMETSGRGTDVKMEE